MPRTTLADGTDWMNDVVKKEWNLTMEGAFSYSSPWSQVDTMFVHFRLNGT